MATWTSQWIYNKHVRQGGNPRGNQDKEGLKRLHIPLCVYMCVCVRVCLYWQMSIKRKDLHQVERNLEAYFCFLGTCFIHLQRRPEQVDGLRERRNKRHTSGRGHMAPVPWHTSRRKLRHSHLKWFHHDNWEIQGGNNRLGAQREDELKIGRLARKLGVLAGMDPEGEGWNKTYSCTLYARAKQPLTNCMY